MTPTDENNQATPNKIGTKQIKITGNKTAENLGTPKKIRYPENQTAIAIIACISTVATVTTGNNSKGKTTFFTKFGLVVINVLALLRHSENALNTINPANSIRAYSAVSLEDPQRVLRITPKAIVYTLSRNNGWTKDQAIPPKEPRYLPVNSRLVNSHIRLRC